MTALSENLGGITHREPSAMLTSIPRRPSPAEADTAKFANVPALQGVERSPSEPTAYVAPADTTHDNLPGLPGTDAVVTDLEGKLAKGKPLVDIPQGSVPVPSGETFSYVVQRWGETRAASRIRRRRDYAHLGGVTRGPRSTSPAIPARG